MKQQGSKLLLTAAAVGATFLATDSSQVKADSVNQNLVRGTNSQQVVQSQTNNGSQAERQKADADRDVGDASREVQKANAAVDSARENLQTAKDKQKGAAVAVSDAKNDVTEAHNGGVDKAHQAVSNATTDLSDAREEQNQAHNNLNSANEETTEQQKKTDQSQKEYDKAKKNKEQAQKDSKEAHAAVNEQQKYVDGLTEENLNQSKENTQNQLNNNQTAKTDKEKELEAAKAEQAQAKDDVADKQSAKDKADQEVADQDPDQALQVADNKIDAAYNKYLDAQNRYDSLPHLNMTPKQVQMWKELLALDYNDPNFDRMSDELNKSMDANNYYEPSTAPEDNKLYTSPDQLTNEDYEKLNAFGLELINQARGYFRNDGKKLQYYQVDIEAVREMNGAFIHHGNNVYWDDEKIDKITEKYHISQGSSSHIDISFLENGGFSLSDIMNYMYYEIWADLFSSSTDKEGDNEAYGFLGQDLNPYIHHEDEHIIFMLDNEGHFTSFGVYDYDFDGISPDKTPIKASLHAADYKDAYEQAKQEYEAAEDAYDDLWNSIYGNGYEDTYLTQKTVSVTEIAHQAATALAASQAHLSEMNQKVESLNEEIIQLTSQIAGNQAKVAEIEDTLANLPEKQAEAKQKLADLKADSALKDETLKITQNELQEKEATLATAKEQLAIVTDAQADAQFIADQADQDVISLEADLQDAQAYQYRMEHADELLSVAQAQLTMAEQAVTDAENELVSVTSNQAQAQQKLSQAKEKQKQAQKNYDLLMSASHAKQSNVNGADVITLSHQTVVLPSNQKSNSDKVVLPETGVKKDAPAFGVLGLLLVSLGLGSFAKSKDRRRHA